MVLHKLLEVRQVVIHCYKKEKKEKEKRFFFFFLIKSSVSDIIGCPLYCHFPSDMPVLPLAQHCLFFHLPNTVCL